MNNKRVMVVCDDVRLGDIVDGLRKLGAQAVGFNAAESAFAALKSQPQSFEFAIVSENLGGGVNGVETIGRFLDLNGNLFCLILGDVLDDPSEIARRKETILSAGAYRYIENRPNTIEQIAAEIE